MISTKNVNFHQIPGFSEILRKFSSYFGQMAIPALLIIEQKALMNDDAIPTKI